MSSTLRKFAFAAVVAGIAGPASASLEVLIDFDLLTGSPPNQQQAVVGDTYLNSKGVRFGGATAVNIALFSKDQTDSVSSGGLGRPISNTTDFAQSVPLDAAGNNLNDNPSNIALTAVGRDIQELFFDLSVGATTFYIWAFNPQGVLVASPPQTSGGTWAWTPKSFDFSGLAIGVVERVEFRSDSTFAIDNVRLVFANDTGGNVPEPASFGLVMLALGMAAFARRQRLR